MNTFFLYWADLSAMLLSMLFAIIYTIRLKKTAVQPLRAIPLFFLLFGPFVVAVHMGFHNAEIVYRALVNVAAGKFIYTFRFYALLLMGVLIMWLSILFLQHSIGVYVTHSVSKSSFYKTAGLIALVTLPTVPFTPIGSLPVMACIISLAAAVFVVKKSSAVQNAPLLGLKG